MRRQHLVTLVAVLALVALFPTSASASGLETEILIDDDRIQGVAQRDGTQQRGPACDWASVDASGSVGSGRSAEAQIQVFHGLAHILFQRTCPNGTAALVWVPQVTAQALLPALRDQVEARLHYPEAVFQPMDEAGLSYVQVPLDFRTTPQTWQPIVVTASIDGPPGLDPWVTITARPAELRFASGDPTDPGLVAGCVGEAAIAPYDPERPGPCSYIYRNASTTVAGDMFRSELGIAWDVTYDSSDGSGTLTMSPTITSAPIRVGEIKALITCTGPDPQQGNC